MRERASQPQMSEQGSSAERAHKQVVVSCLHVCVCVYYMHTYVWCVRSGLAWLPHLYAKHTQKHSLAAVHCALSLSFFSMFALRERKPVNVCTSVRVTLRFQANSMKRN